MSEQKQRSSWFIYPVNEEKTRGFAYRELRDDESKRLCLKACEVLPGEITLTREEFREAFAKAYATLENARKELDATLGFAIERVLFESEESEKTMSQDVTDKSQEFVQCPTCAGLGSIKRHSSDYIRLTGKCPFDGTVLYDPTTNPKLVLRECEKCGKVWFLERKEIRRMWGEE